jgi:hypothetical protein
MTSILIFTEDTVLMHNSAKGKTREEIVQQSKEFGIQMEKKSSEDKEGVCGNDICEPSLGESKKSCSQDCSAQ